MPRRSPAASTSRASTGRAQSAGRRISARVCRNRKSARGRCRTTNAITSVPSRDWREFCLSKPPLREGNRPAPSDRPRREFAVFSFALKTLLSDRGKLLTGLAGVIFSLVLVNVQGGLCLGLMRKASLLIDHCDADLWVGHRMIENVD